MRTPTRRDILKLGCAGAVGGVLFPLFGSPRLRLALAGGGPISAKKMIVIFMRGGNDGVNTIIPHGDSEYSQAARPTLYIDPADSLPLGNGFAAYHPALQPLHELHQLGQVASIHRVAYDGQSRSHFDSQQFWENAVPGAADLEEGWLYRQALQTYDLGANPLAGASFSNRQMLLTKGAASLPHILDLGTYNLEVPGTSSAKLLGQVPVGADPGSGLLGWFGRTGESTFGYNETLGSAGISVANALGELEAAGLDPETYLPQNGATYPDADNPEGFFGESLEFFSHLRDAAMVTKSTDLRVAGVELNGFDTHSNQGSLAGTQANLLRAVAHGIRSLSLDLADQWDDLLVVTLSEFGRTSAQNGSGGTDHGEASCMFVAGGSVQGGVYNCDATTWAEGDLFSTPNERYVTHRTDYRAILREVLEGHFSLDATTTEIILPGIGDLSGDPKFANLGILS